MLDLPKTDDPEAFATWVELSAIAAENGRVTWGTVSEAFRDSGLFDAGSSDEDTAENATGTTWKVLDQRNQMLGTTWPFELTDVALIVRTSKATLESCAAYTAMMLIEAAGGKWYSTLRIEPGDPVRTWFEHITEASLSRILSGTTIRFGAPYPAGCPAEFPARVTFLAGRFGLHAREEEIDEHTSDQQKDDTVDVVARWRIGNEEPGSLFLLVQCATGAGWQADKIGVPRGDLWTDYVAWNGPLVTALAVPFVVSEKRVLLRAGKRRLFLDRLRLSVGSPDDLLASSMRKPIADWCRNKLALIPRL
ncbi:MAG: hypothetical protein U0836_16235 [Pirellulales bacterium]